MDSLHLSVFILDIRRFTTIIIAITTTTTTTSIAAATTPIITGIPAQRGWVGGYKNVPMIHAYSAKLLCQPPNSNHSVYMRGCGHHSNRPHCIIQLICTFGTFLLHLDISTVRTRATTLPGAGSNGVGITPRRIVLS